MVEIGERVASILDHIDDLTRIAAGPIMEGLAGLERLMIEGLRAQGWTVQRQASWWKAIPPTEYSPRE